MDKSSDTLILSGVWGAQSGVLRIRVRGTLTRSAIGTLRLALAQATTGDLRRLEVVLDDAGFFAERGLLGLADAQGYLGKRIVLIYAGRNIGELVRQLGIDAAS